MCRRRTGTERGGSTLPADDTPLSLSNFRSIFSYAPAQVVSRACLSTGGPGTSAMSEALPSVDDVG